MDRALIQTVVTAEQKRRFEDLAKSKGLSMSALMRMFIIEIFAREDKQR